MKLLEMQIKLIGKQMGFLFAKKQSGQWNKRLNEMLMTALNYEIAFKRLHRNLNLKKPLNFCNESNVKINLNLNSKS